MITNARFTENETGTPVYVDSVFGWKPLGHAVMVVTYPTGLRYALSEREFALHFTIVSPQEISLQAFGLDERPTLKQRELQEV